MLRRTASILVGLAVLFAWGMPIHPLCCGFPDAGQARVESNCCPVQGCGLEQARGAVPASIETSRLLDTAFSALQLELTIPSIPGFSVRQTPLLIDSRSSPPRRRPTAERLSIFRI